MADIRKVIIIFVIAVLFSVLVFSVIEAVYPAPKYEDFCKGSLLYREPQQIVKEPKDCIGLNVTKEEIKECEEQHGSIMYDYDSRGCSIDYECNRCDYEFRQAEEEYSRYLFYISALLSLIAIFIGLYLPAKKNTLNEWMGTGFMLGGTFALFFGTLRSFIFLDRYVRPTVILLELALIIFISYRKIGNLREDRKKRKR